MEEEKTVSQEELEKQEQIENRVIELYDEIQKRIDDNDSKEKIEKITYYKELQVVPIENEKNKENIGGVDLSDSYVVRIINEKERVLCEIYNNNMLIATMDEEGTITFSEEYKQTFENIENGQLLVNEMEKLESQKVELKEPEEEKENDQCNEKKVNKIEYTPEKIEEMKANRAKAEEKEQEVEDAPNEEEEQEIIAKKMGMDKSSILSCEKIPPQSFVTRSETFEEVAGIKGKYKEIYVVAVNHKASENKKFEFVGINENGEAEEIPELSTRGSTTTDKSVYAMNKDGSVVQEKQVTQLFNTGDPYKNLSITMGDYGRIEVEYLRKSLEENKWIGSPVETSKQERIQGNVKRSMDDKITSKYDVTKKVENAEHQLGRRGIEGELDSKETSLENIDTIEGNENYTNYNEEIKLHDGTTTTINKEAERCGKTLNEYVQMIEEIKADCLSKKIEIARQTPEAKQEQEQEKEMDRGEREMLTPEEEAEQEAYKQQFYNMKNDM